MVDADILSINWVNSLEVTNSFAFNSLHAIFSFLSLGRDKLIVLEFISIPRNCIICVGNSTDFSGSQ